MATQFANKNSQYTSFAVSSEGFRKLSKAISNPKKPTKKLVALMKNSNSSLKK